MRIKISLQTQPFGLNYYYYYLFNLTRILLELKKILTKIILQK